MTLLCYLMFCFFTLQRELSFKVQIFEKKVESYKKMTHKLSNAKGYVKVKLLSHLKLSLKQQEPFIGYKRTSQDKQSTIHCRDLISFI